MVELAFLKVPKFHKDNSMNSDVHMHSRKDFVVNLTDFKSFTGLYVC